MKNLALSSTELALVDQVIASVSFGIYPLDPIVDYQTFKRLSIYAHRMPERLVQFILDFKYDEDTDGACLIQGFEIDDSRIRQTPDHWRSYETPYSALREEVFLLLCSSLLGDGIGWHSQQEGRIMHNIIPIKGDEYKQEGSSTLTDLYWHTEEAFHPYRCDYLGLLCLRNYENAVTTFASVRDLALTDPDKELLFQPFYTILPDTSHLAAENLSKGIKEMVEQPRRIPILYGDFVHPYLCIDPIYTTDEFNNEEAKRAYEKVVNEIEKNIQSIVLKSGDLLVIDNCRAVHGRRAFQSSYGSNSRWLKRLSIARDLRKSRAARVDFRDRIIHT